MLKGKGKAGKKRSKPTSSSEESPPKEYVPDRQSKESGRSGEAAANPDSTKAPDKSAASSSALKISPSKLDVASQHTETKKGVVQNLSADQITEVGVRIFQKWTWWRQKLRVKLDSGLKKCKVTLEKPPLEDDKSVPVEKSGMPNMVNLINDEIESLEKVASEVEAEQDEEFRQDPSEQADETWERYRFKKDAFSRHKVARCLAITLRESVEMMDRLTVAMSDMQLKIRGSSIAEAEAVESHPELDTFFHDLRETRDRLNSQSSSDDSLQMSKSSSSRDSMVTHASRSPPKSPPSKSAPL